MHRTLLIAALIAAAPACIVYTPGNGGNGGNGGPRYEEPVVVNYAPEILSAEAGCYWDGYYHDDIWYFEADVDDLDGLRDITQVWADVYDEWDGSLVESFELYPTDDPYLWFSDWLGSSTWLDCWYGNYTVDFVAYDAYEDYDVVTVRPYTY